PYPNGNALQKLAMHQLKQPIPVEELRPQVPPPLAALVRKLMAKKREDRHQKPAEVASDLAGILQQLDGDCLAWDWKPSLEAKNREPITPAPQEAPAEHGTSLAKYIVTAIVVLAIALIILLSALGSR